MSLYLGGELVRARPEGDSDWGLLVRDAAGNLYGPTNVGGSGGCEGFSHVPGCGTVFKLSPTGSLTVVYNFTGAPTDGANPVAGLIEDAAGNLYGTTEFGGVASSNCIHSNMFAQSCGVVFKLTPSGTETALYSFTGGAGGPNPLTGLILAPANTRPPLGSAIFVGGGFGEVISYDTRPVRLMPWRAQGPAR